MFSNSNTLISSVAKGFNCFVDTGLAEVPTTLGPRELKDALGDDETPKVFETWRDKPPLARGISCAETMVSHSVTGSKIRCMQI